MKKLFTLLLLGCSAWTAAHAQNIGISATGTKPDSSAMLDISTTNKGFLAPRMSSAQRTAISKPARGLLVFDTDTGSFWFFSSAAWIELTSGSATNYWSTGGANIFNNNSGFVGIGTNTPAAPLHIKHDAEALRLEGTGSSLDFVDSGTTAPVAFVQSTNDNLNLGTSSGNVYGATQIISNGNVEMTVYPSGQVAIDNSLGSSSLQVGASVYPTAVLSLSGVNGGLMGVVESPAATNLVSTNNFIFSPGGTGNFGISATNPINKFQIGNSTGYTGNDLAIANNGQEFGIYQSGAYNAINSTTNIGLMPGTGLGNLGIGTTRPVNKLQIGVMGAAGFNGNDLAIAEGDQAFGIAQATTVTIIASSTDIALNPRNNGHGRVGINTNTPRATLDILDYVVQGDHYYSWLNGASSNIGIGACNPCTPAVSIYAASGVLATEFDANSDARIKNVVSVSDAGKDLDLINSLRITNYTMKDKMKYGNKPFKKVIAQEVEKVYPQVVSRHTDFIPNVYQVSNQLKKIPGGYVLSFLDPHHISPTAKKLRVMLNPAEGMKDLNILALPSDHEVAITIADSNLEKAFVYGEEVDDFRTVDYEGLTTLNISATQALSRRLKSQDQRIDQLARMVQSLQPKKVNRLATYRKWPARPRRPNSSRLLRKG